MRESWFFRCLFLVACGATLWLSLLDNPPEPPMNLSDKTQHFVAFLVLFWLADFAWKPNQHMPNKAAGLLLFGLLIEGLQSFSQVRVTEWGDVLADSGGIVLYWVTHPWALRMAFWRRWLTTADA